MGGAAAESWGRLIPFPSGDGPGPSRPNRMRSDFSSICRDLLRSDVGVRMHVHGASMYPTLRTGDLVDLRPIAGRVRRGDLILFDSSRGVTLHRVVRTGAAGIVTRGDAATTHDALVQPHDVLGIVASRTREGRTVALGRPRLLSSLVTSRIRFSFRRFRRALRRWAEPAVAFRGRGLAS